MTQIFAGGSSEVPSDEKDDGGEAEETLRDLNFDSREDGFCYVLEMRTRRCRLRLRKSLAMCKRTPEPLMWIVCVVMLSLSITLTWLFSRVEYADEVDIHFARHSYKASCRVIDITREENFRLEREARPIVASHDSSLNQFLAWRVEVTLKTDTVSCKELCVRVPNFCFHGNVALDIPEKTMSTLRQDAQTSEKRSSFGEKKPPAINASSAKAIASLLSLISNCSEACEASKFRFHLEHRILVRRNVFAKSWFERDPVLAEGQLAMKSLIMGTDADLGLSKKFPPGTEAPCYILPQPASHPACFAEYEYSHCPEGVDLCRWVAVSWHLPQRRNLGKMLFGFAIISWLCWAGFNMMWMNEMMSWVEVILLRVSRRIEKKIVKISKLPVPPKNKIRGLQLCQNVSNCFLFSFLCAHRSMFWLTRTCCGYAEPAVVALLNSNKYQESDDDDDDDEDEDIDTEQKRRMSNLIWYIEKAIKKAQTHIDLMRMRINEVPKILGEASLLESINLAENEILEILDGHPLLELYGLRQLFLMDNDIIDIASLGHLDKLQILDLDNNSLGQGNGLNALPPNLQKLYLNKNGLSGISEEITILEKCQWLYLAHNAITDIAECEISKMQALTKLTLSHNSLRRLPTELGLVSSLQELSVTDNSLENIPNSICALKQLRVLRLDKNKIQELPKNIGQLTVLEILNCGHNKIKEMPESMVKLRLCKEIIFQSNVLTKLPFWVGHMYTAEILDFRDNYIPLENGKEIGARLRRQALAFTASKTLGPALTSAGRRAGTNAIVLPPLPSMKRSLPKNNGGGGEEAEESTLNKEDDGNEYLAKAIENNHYRSNCAEKDAENGKGSGEKENGAAKSEEDVGSEVVSAQLSNPTLKPNPPLQPVLTRLLLV